MYNLILTKIIKLKIKVHFITALIIESFNLIINCIEIANKLEIV